ncbi:MAG: prepilin-type N-terminal cleavage/methylation domain-containing protein [Planctomycetota bacterium]
MSAPLLLTVYCVRIVTVMPSIPTRPRHPSALSPNDTTRPADEMIMRGRLGFSLVELTIVIAILAILAALVLPRFANATDDAAEAAAQTNLGLIERQVALYHQTHGVYPDDLKPDWFVGGTLPTNPMADFGTATTVEVFAGDPTQTEPTEKVLASMMSASWWYSPVTGQVRARIRPEQTPLQTLRLYNRINSVDATDLADVMARRIDASPR